VVQGKLEVQSVRVLGGVDYNPLLVVLAPFTLEEEVVLHFLVVQMVMADFLVVMVGGDMD
jgi:hypothetical protein